MTDNELLVALLEGALDRLHTYGWVQGTYGDDRQGYCLIGALWAEKSVQARTRNDLYRAIASLPVGERSDRSIRLFMPIATWNDSPLRTFHDVEVVLKEAINQLQEGTQ